MKEAWTKKRLEKYCKFLTGKNIKVLLNKMRMYCARVHVGCDIIEFNPNKIIKFIIWHECGHMVCNHETISVKNEVDATMWSVLKALQRGYYRVAMNIVDNMNHCGWRKNDMYEVARKEILKQVEDYGFKL